jgi:purine nucleoside permease
MQYPYVRCVKDRSICQVTTGMAEANAAATMMAVGLSRKFDLRKTYFLIAGIAGISPKHGTLGSVVLSKYAVQVALQYELDAREAPEEWRTGYIPFGTSEPFQYPTVTYGTEVFELNEALRDAAFDLASKASLADSEATNEYRKRYANMGPAQEIATRAPSVIKCDTATSDVYYSGKLLSEAFEETSTVWTNGSGVYCMTAQEDNATLEVLVRLSVEQLVDFGRVILLRAGKLIPSDRGRAAS